MKKLLVIVGHSGAGKSTICQHLSTLYQVPLTSFANTGKKFSQSLGYKRIRECYKDMGEKKFRELFSKYFLDSISQCLEHCDHAIIDGLYIDDIAQKLKKTYNTTFVYINVPEAICKKRIANRLNMSFDLVDFEYSIKENIKESLGNANIINDADIIIDGTKDLKNICNEIEELDFWNHPIFL